MRLIAILILCLPCSLSMAAATPIDEALRAGGVVLLIRHATAPGTGDPPGFRLDDCATQRNLSAAGRAEAQAIGARLRGLGLKNAEVLTSQWCRCRETARLAFGEARDWPALNSFFQDPRDKDAQVQQVMVRIAKTRRGDRPLVLVTHQVVVTAVSGVYPQSGEVVVVAPAREGGVRVIGSLKPEAGN
ncbi:MAG: histidine phosphatase family protein [Burkholderiales bacterium]|nr:histidine phosphatase family protein [Burkholderiales bacterium]